MKAIVVANGDLEKGDWWREWCEGTQWIIAADGGTQNALRLGMVPDVVIGDLDSLDEHMRPGLQERGVNFVQHSPRKDETDTELALLYAVRLGAQEIVLLGALGGRLDHALANVFMLVMPQLADIPTFVVTRDYVLSLIRKHAHFSGNPGDLLSLLPLGGDVSGITTQGLEYPLRNETLSFGPARGISNVMIAAEAHVYVGSGLLLAIQHRHPSGQTVGRH